MNDSKFFRIFISVIGLVVLLVLGYMAYRIYQDVFGKRTVSNVVNSESNANVQTKISLSSFESLNGTPYLIAAVSSEQDYRQSYYEKEATSIRNFLFVNGSDKSARRLVTKNNFLFLAYEKLGQQTQPQTVVNNVRGILYQVVTSDTNGDKRLSSSDRKTIALSDVSGANYTEVIPQVDIVLGTHQKDEATLLVFWASGGKNFVTEINIPARKVTLTKQLPPLE
jgi:capsid portal protein